MDTDDFFFTDEANNGDHAERPAGEVPLATLAEGSNRRRTTAKNRTQQRRTDQDVSKIITQAAEEKPHHRDKVLRSLQTFTRAMMGLSHNAKPEELPASVTSEELASWTPGGSAARTRLLKRRLVPVTFRGAHFAASSAVSIHVKKEMEADLAKHGFHRFTFDWNAPFVHDVLWNSVSVDITVRHWLPWAKRTNVDVAESSIPGIKTRFFQWITNQGLTRVKAQFTPAEVAAQRAHAQLPLYGGILSRTSTRQGRFWATYFVTRMRSLTLKKTMQTPCRDESEHIGAAPVWCVRSLDQVALKRAKSAQKKMSVRGLLDRKDVRAPTAEEQKDKPVPARFPQDAYDTNYLLEEGEFQAEHLTTEAMDIEDLGKEMLGKAFGAGYRSPAIMAPRDRRRLNRPARLPAMRRGRLAPRCKCQDEGVYPCSNCDCYLDTDFNS
ncbi:hypothetical protein PSTT_15603 [Puccinia striiformis]|uniref:Uncharacterized protein n=1 Tax=Puccinia striiformis TaxID=27350 RepID=A0A2S4UH48_9BASI|nr:hypothetical protein PSTT_15603 [Puccinia striiformis]